MSAHEEHIGQGHHEEPYVGLLRGISPEVHSHAVSTAHNEGWNQGWRDACVQMELDLKRNKARFCTRWIARQESERRRQLREHAKTWLILSAIIFVICIAPFLFAGSSR